MNEIENKFNCKKFQLTLTYITTKDKVFNEQDLAKAIAKFIKAGDCKELLLVDSETLVNEQIGAKPKATINNIVINYMGLPAQGSVKKITPQEVDDIINDELKLMGYVEGKVS